MDGGNGSPNPRRAALLLAAGGSTRWGGTPKATLDVGGETAIHRMVRLTVDAGIDRAVVVTGEHHAATVAAVAGGPVEFVRNPEPEAGRTGSVQRGLAVIDASIEETLLWPVDHPFVARATVEFLLAASAQDPLALWTLPTFEGHGGHPVVIKPGAVDAIGALRPDQPLRSVLPRLGAQVRRVAVADGGVCDSTDTIEEFERARWAWLARGAPDEP